MYLYSDSKISKIATEDIVCYKTYLKDGETLKSPYFNYTIPGIPYVLNSLREPKTIVPEDGYFAIKGGFFHACKDIEAARIIGYYFPEFISVVVKGIIPKGARYFTSIDPYNIQICAEVIHLTELVVDDN